MSLEVPANHSLPLFFSLDYIASTCDFDTVQKSGWIASSLAERPISGVALVAPEPLTADDLTTVHDADYVRAVMSGTSRLSDSSGLGWDPGLWTSACASNGGAVAAAVTAMRSGTNAGSLSSGMHHARRTSGHAFCTFNGLALAARAAIEEGARHVLVLDLDAHCGGGTTSIISAWPEVTHIDVSVSSVDHYRPAEDQTLLVVTRADEYLPAIAAALERVPARCGLVIYNAGMDPHEDSVIGGLRGVTTAVLAEREHRVFSWAQGRGVPVAFVLAGGYTGSRLSREALCDLHRLTIAASWRARTRRP